MSYLSRIIIIVVVLASISSAQTAAARWRPGIYIYVKSLSLCAWNNQSPKRRDRPVVVTDVLIVADNEAIMSDGLSVCVCAYAWAE